MRQLLLKQSLNSCNVRTERFPSNNNNDIIDMELLFPVAYKTQNTLFIIIAAAK